MANERRLRLGFFSYLEGHGSQADIYAQALDLFVAADELGYDVGWVAQHHFGDHGGLPSPFVFFTALAERTRHIGVGTAVITLPLENPIRVAEDAAVFESLHPGRLQLGLGTGFAPEPVMAVFGRSGGDRRSIYDTAIDRIISALNGEPLNDAGDRLHPPAGLLHERLWEGPSTLERVAESAGRGSGLLLSRVAIGAGATPTHEVQVPMVDLYTRTLPTGVAPRVGLSRTVYPSSQPETALRDLTDGLQAMFATRPEQAEALSGFSREELFTHFNIHHGHPDAVIESLSREPLLPQTTDLICQVQPGAPTFDQTLEAIELIATTVAPALGWSPTRDR